MSKRFTDCKLWEKRWFRELSPKHKSFWFYLIHNCDHAGVWEPDFGLASYIIGDDIAESDMANFGDRVERLPSGKWWMNTFIAFQYGELRRNYNPHRPVWRSIEKHNLPQTRQEQSY